VSPPHLRLPPSVPLPPGQIARNDFPRFGLTQYASRFPSRPNDPALSIRVLSSEATVLAYPLSGLTRTQQVTDFHCVTTWSHVGLRWGGVRFADFFRLRVLPQLADPNAVVGVVMRAQDGYKTTLPLADLLADDVLIADELNGMPLSIAHGAPLRLIAPKHYGYKNLKHLAALEFHATTPVIKHGALAFLDHPRARVAEEERGRWFPGWLLRHFYRLFINSTVARFRRSMLERELASK
jgi:DMSO/TMAO reductase YedYZ molybdopterin-dependent catalytic subunit